MSEGKPLLAITMGDPAGIGPEIVVETLGKSQVYEVCRPVVVGDKAVLEAAAQIKGIRVEIVGVESLEEALPQPGRMAVVDLRNVDLARLVRGRVDAAAGNAAYEYVICAADLALRGAVAAIVTAPLNKVALSLAGCLLSGHTEILAERCGVEQVTMMLVAGDLRVSHVSTHVSLRKACELVRRPRILSVVELTRAAVVEMGIEAPRIAVAGLNPHAGEGGLFGDEELREISPAVAEARERGYDVVGPLPPDTIFLDSARGFDAVVAMYHDQGHIPVKVRDFQGGVNVTLGLPIVRTSVDHGTAFDIAGTGRASPASLIAAITLAARMAAARCRSVGP